MEEKLFGIPMREVRRQLACSIDPPRFNLSPPLFGGDDALGSLISSGKEILKDPKNKNFFHQLYHGL